MGGTGSREDGEPAIHFSHEEKQNISEMFNKISHGKKIITKDQLQAFTYKILGMELSGNMYELMVLSGHKHSHHEGGIHLQQFLHSLSSLLRGSVEERSHIILYLAADRRSEVTGQQLVKFVTILIYCFARIAERRPEFKSWILHHSEESFTRLALCMLEDLFHTGDPKERGMKLPVVPQTVYEQTQIEDWVSKSNLFLQMFEQIFQECFPIEAQEDPASKEANPSHHEDNPTHEGGNPAHKADNPTPQEHHFVSPLTPRIPMARMVNWSTMKTILDFPSLVYLNSILPPDKQSEWRLVFSNLLFGDSFEQLVQKITLKGPTVIIVRDKDGYMFGGYASQHWDFNAKFMGDDKCFLFTLKPHYGVYTPTGYNNHFMYFNHHVKTLPNGVGMGGQFDYFGLWLDHTFSSGHSKAGPRCTTYGSPQLSGKPEFEVDVIEVWAVGPEKKVEDDDITDESRKKKSILDKDPQAMAMLSLIGKGPVSDGFREEDDTKDIPEHNQVISLF